MPKKTKVQCPVCYGPLEFRDVAPCWECGGLQHEIDHFREGKHTYATFEVMGQLLVLCDFCMVDMTSYDPSFFGLPPRRWIELRDMIPVYLPEPDDCIVNDKYCASCGYRLKFLEFIRAMRDEHIA